MTQTPLSIYMIFLLLLLIAGCKIARRKEFHEDFLSYPIVKGLQGFAAMAVILHHVTQDVTQYGRYDRGAIGLFNDIGVLFTGMFFFFSGYGLIVSVLEKKDYLKGFLGKRLPAVIIPFYVCNLLFVAVRYMTGYKADSSQWITYISGGILMNDQMWFIVELAFLYVGFFFIFRKRKSDASALLWMAVYIALLTGGSLLLGHDKLSGTLGLWFHGEWWYNTTWLFFLGMLVAKNKDKLVSFAKKNYIWLLPVEILATVGLYWGTMYMFGAAGYYRESATNPGYWEKLLTASVQTAFVATFVITILLITMKLQFKNRALSFLGTIALETYLIQNIFIVNFTKEIKNDFLFFLAVYIATIFTAYVVHLINQWLLHKVTGKK